MGGRVKTLHPKLYAGLLALRDDPDHMLAAEQQGIEFVDLVCVNLYPFERTAARRGATDHEVIENIDIGGPTMIRAAAKNYGFTAVVTRPEMYDAVLQELTDAEGRLSLGTRESLAAEAFSYTARYDTAIARWFAEKQEDFPPLLMSAYEKVTDLAYGENPHQRAAYYSQVGARMHVLSMVKQVAGKDLSFNNVLDLNSGRLLVEEFSIPACAIIKHNNPCGAAIGALRAARPTSAPSRATRSRRSAASSASTGRSTASSPSSSLAQFCEVLFAPKLHRRRARAARGQAEHAHPRGQRAAPVRHRRARPQARDGRPARPGPRHRPRGPLGDGGRHRAQAERGRVGRDAVRLEGVQARPLERDRAVARELATVGIGAGQMSRVDSVRLAIEKARDAGGALQGAALASDAFFPFADGPQLAVEAGVTSIIQPGGSKRDLEVVEAADAAGISMVFTHRRHFKH